MTRLRTEGLLSPVSTFAPHPHRVRFSVVSFRDAPGSLKAPLAPPQKPQE